ncbi:MAG: aminopeptidase P family protein [Deltaproteobacteria bacterium]|nr:aminopeptidase P family protein [Deltaproteobacteria bacterium]
MKHFNATIKNYFKKYQIGALLVSSLQNVHYLSGFTGSTAVLLVTEKESFFFSDFRYMTQAHTQVKDFTIIEVARDSTSSIAEQLQKFGLTRLGFEAGALTFFQYLSYQRGLPGVELVPIVEDPAYIRMVKTKEEIKKIQKAIHVNKLAFEKILPHIKAGLREKDVAKMLEFEIRNCGGEKLSFDTIIAAGYRGAFPHGRASSKKIKKGELITIDFGNVVENYCSDETCTIGLGKLSSKQKEIYTIVKDAHDFAVEKIKPGKTGKEIDQVARDYITKKGYGKFFGHGLGHGIGIAVHERPMVNTTSSDVLDENMVFSIEPGIYIPKWGGIRIEDLVLCTPRGGRVLSEIDKRLRIIDA